MRNTTVASHEAQRQTTHSHSHSHSHTVIVTGTGTGTGTGTATVTGTPSHGNPHTPSASCLPPSTRLHNATLSGLVIMRAAEGALGPACLSHSSVQSPLGQGCERFRAVSDARARALTQIGGAARSDHALVWASSERRTRCPIPMQHRLGVPSPDASEREETRLPT